MTIALVFAGLRNVSRETFHAFKRRLKRERVLATKEMIAMLSPAAGETCCFAWCVRDGPARDHCGVHERGIAHAASAAQYFRSKGKDMAKYRKTALTEAHQLSDEVYPAWLSILFAEGRVKFQDGQCVVGTREGLKTTSLEDWIAIDNNGDPYPIAADVFAATYEPAE